MTEQQEKIYKEVLMSLEVLQQYMKYDDKKRDHLLLLIGITIDKLTEYKEEQS